METWRFALLYCAKHLLHFDEAKQRRAREGVERNKEGVSERESTRGQGRCVLAQILTESDAEEGGMVGKGKFSE